MKTLRSKGWIILKKNFVVVIGLLMVGLLIFTGCQTSKTTSNKNNAAVVSTVKVAKGQLDDSTTISGKLEAFASANVVPKVAGKVDRIPVDIGSEVREGDLLVALDAPELLAAVNQAEANLQKAKESDLSNLKNQALSTVTTSETTLKNAESDYNRAKALFAEKAVSQQSLDQSEKTFSLAQSAYDLARQNLNTIENGTIPNTIKVNEAALAQARANYANMVVTAPISGVITAKNVNVGEKTPTDKPVVSIVNLDKVVVQASVNEDKVNNLSVGQKISVVLAAVSDKPFEGEITNVSYAADTTTKAYQIKIQISNANHKLKPGMFAEVKLEGSKESFLLVPREAVLTADQKSYVFTTDGQKVQRKEVKIGRSDCKNMAISSGLNGGEDIVAAGIDALQDGMKVTVQNK